MQQPCYSMPLKPGVRCISDMYAQKVCVRLLSHTQTGSYKRGMCGKNVCAFSILQSRRTRGFQEVTAGEIILQTTQCSEKCCSKEHL